MTKLIPEFDCRHQFYVFQGIFLTQVQISEESHSDKTLKIL